MKRAISIAFAAGTLWALVTSSALAQAPYDGIQAGLDAWRLAEERRQGQVADQLRTTDELKFWSGLPTSRGEILLEPYPLYDPVFGPVYGYDYGVGYAPPTVRQPVGRVEMQTGPNRWESHPVYDPPLSAALPSPPVNSPWLDRTPYARPPAAPVEAVPTPTPTDRPLIEAAENGEAWPEQRTNQTSTGSDPAPLPPGEIIPPPPSRER